MGTTHADVAASVGIQGLAFRAFRREADFETMSRVSRESWAADGIEWSVSTEDVANDFRHSARHSAERDILFAEVGAQVVGYGEVRWLPKDASTTVYSQIAHLLPAWRGKGIREALLTLNENRLREIARGHPSGIRKEFESWAADDPNDWRAQLERAGYAPAWKLIEMVRPHLEDVPEARLPGGLAVRPARPADYPKVWEGMREAYRGEPWYSDEAFEASAYRRWLGSTQFMPQLWQVAWDGDVIAGAVQNYVLEDFNRAIGRRHGFTEGIFVAAPYRGRGLAKALIARSVRVHRDLGMEEVGLDVNAENPHRAVRLYESLGYRTVKRFTFYRRPITGVA